MPCLQPREMIWDQTLNAHGVEEWCFRGRGNLSVSEPRRERGSRKGEINVARERGVAWWEGQGRHMTSH